MSSRGAAMRTSRKESSAAGGVDSEAVRECGQTPAMEEGTGVKPGCAPGCSVLHSPSLLSLVGEECLQMLRCSICKEFFNIPIVLPCGHTFCLQCLTDMCKQASQPRGQSASLTGTEPLIGCPTCHVRIFATPILQRNVTCNFIIQTLVDTLRNKKSPSWTNVSVNTERSLVGPPVRAVSEEALCGVLQDLDRLSASLHHRSIVDDAFFEIEQIRWCHLSDPDRGKVIGKADSLTSSDAPGQVRDMVTSLTSASDSPTLRTGFLPQQDSGVKNSLQTLKRCYAAALASGRSRSPAAVPATSKNADLGVGRTKAYCCKPLQSNVSTLPVPCFTQFGRNPSSISQNRNRNNPRPVFEISSKQTVSTSPQSTPCFCVGPISRLTHSDRMMKNLVGRKLRYQSRCESLHQLANQTQDRMNANTDNESVELRNLQFMRKVDALLETVRRHQVL